jgi:hypothetical protein
MPSSLARAVFAALLAAAPPVSPAARAQAVPPSATRVELFERILAVVDGRPLFLSEVRALEILKGLDQDQALKNAIDARLMYQEAARVPQADVTAEDEERALAQLEEQRPGVTGKIDEGELRRLVRRELAILKYVEFRFRPQLGISDEDVRRVFEAEELGEDAEAPARRISGGGERAPGGGGPSPERSAAIRSRLERRAIDERIEAWVKELRERASLRYVPDDGGPADRGEAPPAP